MNSQRLNRSSFASAAAAVLALAATTALAADGRVQTITARDQGGPVDGVFSSFDGPVLNNNGQIAFRAALSGAGIDTSNDRGIFLFTGGQLAQIAREGTTATSLEPLLSLNLNGGVLFEGVHGASIDAAFLYNGNSVSELVRDGQAVAGATVVSYSRPVLNNLNQVAFHGTFTGNAQRIMLREPNGFTIAARTGEAAPDGNGTLSTFSRPTINDAGEIAFGANLTGNTGGTSTDSAIYTSFTDSFSFRRTRLVVREGQNVSGIGTFGADSRGPVIINGNSQVLLPAFVPSTLGGSGTDAAIFRNTGTLTSLSEIARQSRTVPGGDGRFGSTFFLQYMNDAGQVAFVGSIEGSSLGEASDRGLYRRSGSITTEIVREGRLSPDGNGRFSDSFSAAGMMPTGQVLFSAFLSDTIGGPSADGTGIFLGDGQETITVARYGQPLAGSTIVSLGTQGSQGMNSLHASSLNDFGQVAYSAKLANGHEGIFLFTPTLRYRAAVNGDWDDAGNWTVGILPAHVHDVKLDSSASVKITGPSQDTTVHTLQVGGGAGQVELALQRGARLSVASGPVVVEPPGMLGGDGIIAADVINRGTIRPQNVVLTGQLQNQGTLWLNGPQGGTAPARLAAPVVVNDGTIRGSGLLDAVLVNGSGGDVRVASAESLRVSGVASNAGRIENFGGSIEFDKALQNSGAGLIVARDATLRFNGGLTNAARLAINFGQTSDVFGNITNQLAGRIHVSGNANASFFGDVTNAGNVRVDSGSMAVFLGSYSGAGSISGGGQVSFESAVGTGPGTAIVSASGDVSFGAFSRLNIELGGTVPGTQYDRISVDGSVELDGTLDISLQGGWTPSIGDRFRVITATDGISGRFHAVQRPGLASGMGWALLTEPTMVELVAALMGDANLDGRVSLQDFNVVASNFGQAGHDWRGGDFNGDGLVNLQDFNALAIHFGVVASGPEVAPEDWSALAAAVPEPGIAGIVATSLLLCRRRRRS